MDISDADLSYISKLILAKAENSIFVSFLSVSQMKEIHIYGIKLNMLKLIKFIIFHVFTALMKISASK